jgi:hypothetical protein
MNRRIGRRGGLEGWLDDLPVRELVDLGRWLERLADALDRVVAPVERSLRGASRSVSRSYFRRKAAFGSLRLVRRAEK